MIFPAKILKPLRITIPDAVGEALDLNPGDLVEVNIKKLPKSTRSAQPVKARGESETASSHERKDPPMAHIPAQMDRLTKS